MAQFKCKHSGTIVSFDSEYDSAQMRSHPDYEEVKQEAKPVEKPAKKTAVKTEEE